MTKADIEKQIVGKWIVSELDGKPALTNEKGVLTFESPELAYLSASFDSLVNKPTYWGSKQETEVSIEGNTLTLTRKMDNHQSLVDVWEVSSISSDEMQGMLTVKEINDGKETVLSEKEIRSVKIDDDYSDKIVGTWEGRRTSEGSVFDDGMEHRWKFNDDGTFVYYSKAGDNWTTDQDSDGEYFVDGSLLCSRWTEYGELCREWWEISISGDKMIWTALRTDNDGKTFRASFEMSKVQA